MEELVIAGKTGKDVTTSLIVAQVFGKRHDNVLRDIKNLSCSNTFHPLNFELLVEMRELPQGGAARAEWYEMTKDGFSFLAMGYAGEKAGEFKEKFINEFNKREEMLKSDDYILARSQEILQNRLQIAQQRIQTLKREKDDLWETIEMQILELQEQAPKVEYHDKVLSSKSHLTVNMIAAELGISHIKLNKLLCEWGIQYKQTDCYLLRYQYRDKGYTVYRPYSYCDIYGETHTKQRMYWTEKGKKFIIEVYHEMIAA
jgi:Rha family phage regulatory protein